MDRIASFTINHLDLMPGLYVSRRDAKGDCVTTTFDLEMCDFIIGFEGEIPGAAPEQCGNYQEQNLDMAKYYIKKYKDALVNDRHLVYPE